jgi:hypothetical protein
VQHPQFHRADLRPLQESGMPGQVPSPEMVDMVDQIRTGLTGVPLGEQTGLNPHVSIRQAMGPGSLLLGRTGGHGVARHEMRLEGAAGAGNDSHGSCRQGWTAQHPYYRRLKPCRFVQTKRRWVYIYIFCVISTALLTPSRCWQCQEKTDPGDWPAMAVVIGR